LAGYSGTPLTQKLGVKPGMVVAVLDEPDGFRNLLTDLPDDVTLRTDLRARSDLVISFFRERRRFEARLATVTRQLQRDGAWWVCWPKKAARVVTDMTGDVVREVVLPVGLVDVKVAAVDETWSGLEVMWRRSMR
jgi:hypothetical protein